MERGLYSLSLYMNPRIKKLQEKIKSENIDGFISFNSSNIYYLSGFKADGSFIFVSPKKAVLAVPQLLYLSAKDSTDCDLMVVKKIEDVFKAFKVKNIGFEEAVSYKRYSILKEIKNIEMRNLSGLVENMRIIKEQEEIFKIKCAGKISMKAIEFAEKIIRTGMTEKELADKLEFFLRRKGAEKSSFDIIVASGENSAKPHHIPTYRKLQKGDSIVIDIGCVCDGYCSDLTRTLFLSKINESKKKVFNIVKDAQKRAISTIKSGVACKKIDFSARDYIRSKGYGKFFIHSTGHGIGIDVHEEPNISANSTTFLQKGMMVTVEPGIYIPNQFGVRIEDMVLVKESGYEVITK